MTFIKILNKHLHLNSFKHLLKIERIENSFKLSFSKQNCKSRIVCQKWKKFNSMLVNTLTNCSLMKMWRSKNQLNDKKVIKLFLIINSAFNKQSAQWHFYQFFTCMCQNHNTRTMTYLLEIVDQFYQHLNCDLLFIVKIIHIEIKIMIYKISIVSQNLNRLWLLKEIF